MHHAEAATLAKRLGYEARPAASRIVLSDVMEHRVPDLVIAPHRTEAMEAEGGQLHKTQLEANTLFVRN